MQEGRSGAAGPSRREGERRGTASARRLEPEPEPVIRRPRAEVGAGGRQGCRLGEEDRTLPLALKVCLVIDLIIFLLKLYFMGLICIRKYNCVLNPFTLSDQIDS